MQAYGLSEQCTVVIRYIVIGYNNL